MPLCESMCVCTIAFYCVVCITCSLWRNMKWWFVFLFHICSPSFAACMSLCLSLSSIVIFCIYLHMSAFGCELTSSTELKVVPSSWMRVRSRNRLGHLTAWYLQVGRLLWRPGGPHVKCWSRSNDLPVTGEKWGRTGDKRSDGQSRKDENREKGMEWERGNASPLLGKEGRIWTLMQGPSKFLVTPLLMGRSAYLA